MQVSYRCEEKEFGVRQFISSEDVSKREGDWQGLFNNANIPHHCSRLLYINNDPYLGIFNQPTHHW